MILATGKVFTLQGLKPFSRIMKRYAGKKFKNPDFTL